MRAFGVSYGHTSGRVSYGSGMVGACRRHSRSFDVRDVHGYRSRWPPVQDEGFAVATSGEAANFILYARDARGVPVGFGGEKFAVAMQLDP